MWKYLCDRSKTSTSAETVLQNSDSDQHLLEALTIKNTSPRFSRWQTLWRAMNKHTIAVHKLLDYFNVLFASIRDRWHSRVVWIATAILQREHGTEQSICSNRKALENKQFTVAPRQIYKYFDLQEIREASFPTQVEKYRFQTAFSRLQILFANLLL